MNLKLFLHLFLYERKNAKVKNANEGTDIFFDANSVQLESWKGDQKGFACLGFYLCKIWRFLCENMLRKTE